ncbi:MAG: ferritin family protein [Oscillospiraceae bacterium]
MEKSTTQKLQTYIEAELGDSALYKELAKIAPNSEYRKLLKEFSEDEASHADNFKIIYKTMTGKSYDPVIQQPEIMDTFEDTLRDRVLDESGDFQKYGEQYMRTNNNALKNAYYTARTDENVHALRLLYMLQKI